MGTANLKARTFAIGLRKAFMHACAVATPILQEYPEWNMCRLPFPPEGGCGSCSLSSHLFGTCECCRNRHSFFRFHGRIGVPQRSDGGDLKRYPGTSRFGDFALLLTDRRRWCASGVEAPASPAAVRPMPITMHAHECRRTKNRKGHTHA